MDELGREAAHPQAKTATPPALEAPFPDQERPQCARRRHGLIPLQRRLSQQVARIYPRLEPVPAQAAEAMNDLHARPRQRFRIELTSTYVCGFTYLPNSN